MKEVKYVVLVHTTAIIETINCLKHKWHCVTCKLARQCYFMVYWEYGLSPGILNRLTWVSQSSFNRIVRVLTFCFWTTMSNYKTYWQGVSIQFCYDLSYNESYFWYQHFLINGEEDQIDLSVLIFVTQNKTLALYRSRVYTQSTNEQKTCVLIR